MKFIIIWLFNFFSVAQDVEPEFKVTSLYQGEALLTERFLPFAISDINDKPVTIVSIYAQKPCYSMVDPYRKDIALFYCTEEVSAGFTIHIRKNNQIYLIQTPNINVKKIALISSTPSPDKNNIVDSPGKTLYRTNCIGCHNSSNPMVETVTVSMLKSVFSGQVIGDDGKPILAMKQFNNFFSNKQLDDLVKYINEEL